MTAKKVHWSTTAQLVAYQEREGCVFSAIASPLTGMLTGHWHAIGLVAGAMPSDDPEAGLRGLLDAHAHQALGVYSTLVGPGGAMEALEAFVRKAPVPSALCECEAVMPTSSGPKERSLEGPKRSGSRRARKASAP